MQQILRTPTPPPAAGATLVDLLTALDVRRRYREKMLLSEHARPITAREA